MSSDGVTAGVVVPARPHPRHAALWRVGTLAAPLDVLRAARKDSRDHRLPESERPQRRRPHRVGPRGPHRGVRHALRPARHGGHPPRAAPVPRRRRRRRGRVVRDGARRAAGRRRPGPRLPRLPAGHRSPYRPQQSQGLRPGAPGRKRHGHGGCGRNASGLVRSVGRRTRTLRTQPGGSRVPPASRTLADRAVAHGDRAAARIGGRAAARHLAGRGACAGLPRPCEPAAGVPPGASRGNVVAAVQGDGDQARRVDEGRALAAGACAGRAAPRSLCPVQGTRRRTRRRQRLAARGGGLPRAGQRHPQLPHGQRSGVIGDHCCPRGNEIR
ncbi:hypothetical protein SAXI111661_19150 [Saccharomonospora xinjiangensis]